MVLLVETGGSTEFVGVRGDGAGGIFPEGRLVFGVPRVGLLGCVVITSSVLEGMVLEDVVDVENGIVDVDDGAVDVEDSAVDTVVDSCVVEGDNVDVVALGKVTIQYFTKTFKYKESRFRDKTVTKKGNK